MYNNGIREDTTERDINKKIAEIFFRNEKAIREKHNISQKTMGELFGYTQMCVSNWESGKNLPENLDSVIETVADFFDLDPAMLVREDFADRYDPSVYAEAKEAKEPEKPEDPVPVYEINGNYYDGNQHETDREVAIRYLMSEYRAAQARYIELHNQISEVNTAMNMYAGALVTLGVDMTEKEEKVL